MRFANRVWTGALLSSLLVLVTAGTGAAQNFTFEDMLSPPYPSEMVSAKTVDRIAWISVERGRRNVYTAAAPDFHPVKLTEWNQDNGHDLTSIQISDDGEVLVFVRGHTPNSQGWVANPNNDPQGAERAIWAVGTGGGDAWRVAEGSDPVLSPDGRWVLFEKEGQIYRAPVNTGTADPGWNDALPPLFRAWGRNGDPVWSPDGRFIAFVSQREDHSFIGVYDTEQPSVRYMAPGVDRDTQPTWSPDGTRIAFRRQPGLPFGAQNDRPQDVPRDSIPPGARGGPLRRWPHQLSVDRRPSHRGGSGDLAQPGRHRRFLQYHESHVGPRPPGFSVGARELEALLVGAGRRPPRRPQGTDARGGYGGVREPL